MDGSAKDNIDNAAANALDPTDATVPFHSECEYSGSGETDVSWDTVNLPGTTRGQTYCEDFAGGNCDQFYAELDLAEIANQDDGRAELGITKTACHELGHSAGLTHHSYGATSWGCMVSGKLDSSELKYRRYCSHHIEEHINEWF